MSNLKKTIVQRKESEMEMFIVNELHWQLLVLAGFLAEGQTLPIN